LEFLQIRWAYFKNACNGSPQTPERAQNYVIGRHFNEDLLYDAMPGLQAVAVSETAQPSVIFAAYHCFQEISNSILAPHTGKSPTAEGNCLNLNECFQAVLSKEDGDLSHFPSCSLSLTVRHPSLDILKDENSFLYLKAVVERSCRRGRDGRPIWPTSYLSPQQVIITKHFAELRVRVKAYFYSGPSEQAKEHTNREPGRDEPWDVSFLPLFDSLTGQGDREIIGTSFY
jgi:hypothetical protein